jgi:glycosyltransferase involved in cell wall biosynthesis
VDKKKLLYFVTEDHYFCSHRLELAKEALQNAYDVYVMTNVNNHGSVITDAGLKLIPLNLERKGTNPLTELNHIRTIKKIYTEIQPDIIHHVALKPILYGTIAALFLKKKSKIINAFTGLGYLFTSTKITIKMTAFLMLSLFKFIFKHTKSDIILQNVDDLNFFKTKKLANAEKLHLIRGSGVHLSDFPFNPEPEGEITALFVARMLKDKGTLELIEAAKMLKQENIPLKIIFVGAPDPHNPSSLKEEDIKAWENQGLITWLGHQTKIADFWAQAHIAVLPSYREGLPKSLLEAASCGRPIIATDVPGCREICIEGLNGFLVPVKDAYALKEALKKLTFDAALRQKMGKESRKLVEDHFSIEAVIAQTLDLYTQNDSVHRIVNNSN